MWQFPSNTVVFFFNFNSRKIHHAHWGIIALESIVNTLTCVFKLSWKSVSNWRIFLQENSLFLFEIWLKAMSFRNGLNNANSKSKCIIFRQSRKLICMKQKIPNCTLTHDCKKSVTKFKPETKDGTCRWYLYYDWIWRTVSISNP